MTDRLLDNINWNDQGLVPAIAQDWRSGEVLMLAWMNREALALSVAEGRAVYWSRSRNRLWRKGEESGNVQHLKELRLDCDRDTLLLRVEQEGGVACHTGRRHCFFNKFPDKSFNSSSNNEDGEGWQVCEPVVKAPADMYGETQ